MAKPQIQSMLFVAIALAMPVASAADTSADLLRVLGSHLSAIRATTGNQPLSFEPLPDVRSLPGVNRQEVLTSLGRPDNCAAQTDTQCAGLKEWFFAFYYLPPGWRGGGAALHLTFNAPGVVKEAQWTFSR